MLVRMLELGPQVVLHQWYLLYYYYISREA